MRRYETITIVDPDLSEDERKPILDRITDLISHQEGFLVFMDEWGSKKLAYEIKKKSHGYYVRVDFCGTGALIDEMERFFRIDDRILKYMTVLLDEAADIESIKNEIALAESEAKQAALSREPEPEAISEEAIESDTKAESKTEPETPSEEIESEKLSEKSGKAKADTESETEQAAPSDETESEPPSEKPPEGEAEAQSKTETAAPGDDTKSEKLSEKTAGAKADTGSEVEQAALSEETGSEQLAEKTAEAVFDMLTCGVNVGNQAVLLKGINDDVETFRRLHQKLLTVRIRPYYVFYCEPAPGIDHFRTTVEKGAELIRDALRGHTTGLAQPIYVIATNIGKIPLMPDYYIVGKDEKEYTLRNYKGITTQWPNVPE